MLNNSLEGGAERPCLQEIHLFRACPCCLGSKRWKGLRNLLLVTVGGSDLEDFVVKSRGQSLLTLSN